MKQFKISVNGSWYEVEIKNLDESPISVLVDGELYEVELGPEFSDTRAMEKEPVALALEPTLEVNRPTLRQAQDAATAAGEVIAPMPGKILAVNVEVGDRVQYQDMLCTLEAMKMENEIMAPAAGLIKEVKVVEGQDVLYGDVLLVIES